jgi:hypothetical protein
MWMSSRYGRIAALAATLAVVGGTFVATTPALAENPLNITFANWAVWGSLTPKKTGEPVVLPKGSTFNGVAEITHITETEILAAVTGNLHVPPFKTTIKLAGLLPSTVGVTFTQVEEAKGSIVTGPPGGCAHSLGTGLCVTLSVTSKAILGITAAGFDGIEIPTECVTSEPVTITLSQTLPLNETDEQHFKGETTIPSFTCSGLSGVLLGPALTALESGPENPYAINLGPTEPTAPIIEPEPARAVSQISARLKAVVKAGGEPLTSCHFQYGTTESYGSSLPCVEPPRSGPGKSALLKGLNEGTTYHFRVVATNSIGTTESPDQTFTTLGSAGELEYGQCVAQKKGEYVGSNCGAKSSKPGKGEFEWRPGPAPTCVAQKKGEYTNASCSAKSAKAHKGTFEKAPGAGYTSATGTATLETPDLAGGKVVCAASTDAGEVTGTRTGIDRVTFTGCEESGKACTSEGPNSTPSGKPGVIVTNLLDTKLLGPVEYKVWTHYASSQHEPYFAEFGCEGSLFRTKGSLSGEQSGDVGAMSLTSNTRFERFTFYGGTGEQGLETEESENGGSSWVGPEPSSLIAAASNTAASATEIKA